MDVATEIILQLQLKTIPHFTTLQKAALESVREHYMLQLGDLLESYRLEKYLQGQMRQDLKTDMLHHITHTDVILGTHLPNALQDQI